MEWYPTPSYLLKRKVILDFLKTTDVRTFLEVGCGAGDLLVELGKRSYQGMGIDISAEAVDCARRRLSSTGITVELMPLEEVKDTYDVVIASEVLEHCEDEISFLNLVKKRINKGGWLIITVPAHMNKWDANDDFCGHLRRYERQDILSLFEKTAFKATHIYSYGVPLYNIMKPFYARAITKSLQASDKIEDRTKKSGGMWLCMSMHSIFPLLFNDATLYPFYLFQKLFFNSNLGNGFFAVAQRR